MSIFLVLANPDPRWTNIESLQQQTCWYLVERFRRLRLRLLIILLCISACTHEAVDRLGYRESSHALARNCHHEANFVNH